MALSHFLCFEEFLSVKDFLLSHPRVYNCCLLQTSVARSCECCNSRVSMESTVSIQCFSLSSSLPQHLCILHFSDSAAFRCCSSGNNEMVIIFVFLFLEQEQAFEKILHCVIWKTLIVLDTQQGNFFIAFMCFKAVPETSAYPGSWELEYCVWALKKVPFMGRKKWKYFFKSQNIAYIIQELDLQYLDTVTSH